RVALLATGGLSHSIGEPTMGEIDEPFDRECIRHFESGDERVLVDFLNERLPTIGNGAAEIRNWVAAHGAAGKRGFELIGYCNCPEVYVGCGYASWNLGARAGACGRRLKRGACRSRPGSPSRRSSGRPGCSKARCSTRASATRCAW